MSRCFCLPPIISLEVRYNQISDRGEAGQYANAGQQAHRTLPLQGPTLKSDGFVRGLPRASELLFDQNTLGSEVVANVANSLKQFLKLLLAHGS
jgi:hypothetical protein